MRKSIHPLTPYAAVQNMRRAVRASGAESRTQQYRREAQKSNNDGFLRSYLPFQDNNQPFRLSMTVMDACDVFGGYFYAFDGSQSIFPFRHDAWREVENDDKLCFSVMER